MQGREKVKRGMEIGLELERGLGDSCSEELRKRLKQLASTLEWTLGKVFLRTKEAVPYTSAVLQAAEELREVAGDGNGPASDEFLDQLERFEVEVRGLRAKVENRHIIIT